MKVGVLGSGDVGQVLATGFAALGHEVRMGTREPKKLDAWLAKNAGKKVSVGSFAETANFADTVVVAVQGAVIDDALRLAGYANFDGKTVIDVTNPLDFSAGMPPKLLYGFSTSAGEKIQQAIPKANVVKTLNIVGNASMVNPKFEEGDPDMLLCGNSEGAKADVARLLKELGWKNITDLGGIEQSRIMEPLCLLWVTYALKNNTWSHAFKMLKK